MFIAEAISTTATYYYPDENRNFNFAGMCVSGTIGQWGANTCIPSYSSSEYQKYLLYIAKKAVDLGIQDFAFGQVYLCDNMSNPILPSLMTQIRQYAVSKGKNVVMGGQTNSVQDENYLRSFDYIFGGVGEDPNGNIESGACSSKFSASGFCWALLWNSTFAAKANDVLLHFDWYGGVDDDMDTFSKMSQGLRAQFLSDKYAFFKSKNMGFTMPYLAPLASSGGCYGQNAYQYSPDNKYTCRDEGVISQIFSGSITKKPDLSTCNAASECQSTVCLDGYCGLKPNGWGCLSNGVCASNYCAAGVCTAKKAYLAQCAVAAECAANICLDGYCGLKPNGWGCLSNSVCFG